MFKYMYVHFVVQEPKEVKRRTGSLGAGVVDEDAGNWTPLHWKSNKES